MAPGRYNVAIAIFHDKNWGHRVAGIIVTKCDKANKTYKDLNFAEFLDNIGVDSGQCGIFNDSVFPKVKGSAEEKDFYDDCCSITGSRGGLYGEDGVVTNSGCGDGVYQILIGKNNNGKVHAILLDFSMVVPERTPKLSEEAIEEYCGGNENLKKYLEEQESYLEFEGFDDGDRSQFNAEFMSLYTENFANYIIIAGGGTAN